MADELHIPENINNPGLANDDDDDSEWEYEYHEAETEVGYTTSLALILYPHLLTYSRPSMSPLTCPPSPRTYDQSGNPTRPTHPQQMTLFSQPQRLMMPTLVMHKGPLPIRLKPSKYSTCTPAILWYPTKAASSPAPGPQRSEQIFC